MTQFDEREKSFETKEAHRRELEFKATARRNKLLGLWAAKLLGIADADADSYAQDIVMSDFDEPVGDVLRKIMGDLRAKGVDTSEHLIRTKMDSLLEEARKQVSDEA